MNGQPKRVVSIEPGTSWKTEKISTASSTGLVTLATALQQDLVEAQTKNS